MEKSESIMKLAEALSKAQGIIKGAIKDSENPFFKVSYADLASVWEACRIPLSSNGLSIVQITQIEGDKLILITTLLHNSGEYICSQYPIIPTKQDPQGFGSALTYARRYSMSAIVGIAPEDDDGEMAMGRDKKLPIQEPQKKQKEGTQSPPKKETGEVISDAQRKRFYAIAKGAGKADEQIKEWLYREYDFEHSKDITKALYEEICEKVKGDLSIIQEPPEDGNAQD